MSDERPDTPTQASRPKYQLLMELGRGGMGVAHLAVSRGPQGFAKLVVLKMMRKQLIGDAECYRMFLQEARISARLAHPNVVHVYEVIEYGHAPTLVMEYLEGQTLWSIVRNSALQLPLPLHLHILTKVLAGLHAAHELRDYDGKALNLIHRDVSPHNVCVLFDGQVKVLDFGIAKAATSEVETQVGQLKGKVRYMPPEQLMRENQDRRIDVFAVGVMLWEAIMGRRFWGDAPESDVIANLLARNLPPSETLEAHAPAQLRFICAQALAPDPDYRYATAGEFQRDLEDYLLGQPDRASAEDDLAAFMLKHFDGERQAAKRVIEEHIQVAERVSDSGASGLLSIEASSTMTGIGMARPPPPTSSTVGYDGETRVVATSAGTAAAPAPAALTSPTSVPLREPARRVPILWAVALGAVLGIVMTAVFTLARPTSAGVTARAGGAGAPTCSADGKLCGGQCVSMASPDRGCGGDGCSPCRVPNASARCNQSNRCDIAACHPDFDDCDGDASNGCETNVRSDPDHCRGCGHKCPPLPHGQRGCGDGCTIWRCEGGFRDCNGAVEDGCETQVTTDPANCGHCGRACRAGQKCRGGTCR